MKKIVLIIAAVALGFATAAAQSTPKEYSSYISVQGKVEREVEPNEIHVSITIDEADYKGKSTLAEEEKKMIAALRTLGVDVEKDLMIGDISSELTSYLLRRNKAQTIKEYILKTYDTATLTNVFKKLTEMNISKVQIVKLTRSDMEEIKTELRAEAIKKAQSNASAMAEAIGQSIGKAFVVESYEPYIASYTKQSDYARNAVMGMAEADESTALAIQHKNITISYSVQVKFVLK